MGVIRSKFRTRGMAGKKHKGPLREVKEIIRLGEGMFSHDVVIFTCGHKGYRTPGSIKARCRKCAAAAVEEK